MLKLNLIRPLVAALIQFHLCKTNDVTNGTELVFAFMIHRHGDTTPQERVLRFSTDNVTLKARSAPYGFGQLTSKGMKRAYRLGETIRKRYRDILPEKYNDSRIFIRATEYTRAKMTILTALANIFPDCRDDECRQKIDWPSEPFNTVPGLYDDSLFFKNCPTYLQHQRATFRSSPPSLSKYADVLSKVSKYIKVNITKKPLLIIEANDVFASQLSLDISLPNELAEMYGQIQDAADDALGILLGNKDFIGLEAGPLLNKFYIYARKIIHGIDTPVIRIYSAHDRNVYALQAATKILKKQGVPYYTDLYSLELRRVKSNGRYIVLPVYFPGTEGTENSLYETEDPIYLRVDGCKRLCDFDDFVKITSVYAVDDNEWMRKCKWRQDQRIKVE